MSDKTRAAVSHWLTTAVALVGVLVSNKVFGGNTGEVQHYLGVVVASLAVFGFNVSTGDKTAVVGGSKS